MNNLIGKKYDIDGKTLDWCYHTSSHFTRKSKDCSSIKDKSKISNNSQKKNPNPKDKATGSNGIEGDAKKANRQNLKQATYLWSIYEELVSYLTVKD
ncbi:unnamed protein product [Rhizophagus irregularis]|nr:unnamed protein product [Rhizophagus irregularis]CAB5390137.1 unnamed protein product [Rhizophagus irregularis]